MPTEADRQAQGDAAENALEMASRLKLWSDLPSKGGFSDPFLLHPDMIMKIMGALKWQVSDRRSYYTWTMPMPGTFC